MNLFFKVVSSLVILLSFLSFTFSNKNNSNITRKEFSQSDSINQLLKISNIEDFYFSDNGYNINYLMTYNHNSSNNIKSISIYRKSINQSFILSDSILFDKNGIPKINIEPDKYNDCARTYLFFNAQGDRFLDIYISNNNYDTIYTFRQFDQLHHKCKEIKYNITRKEYGRLSTIDIIPITDSILNLKFSAYESDSKREKMLPFESRDIFIELLQDSTIQTITDRLVYQSPEYNRNYKNFYRLENNYIIPINKQSVFSYNTNNDWIEKTNSELHLKRKFNFYNQLDTEISDNFKINYSILKFLNKQLDSLPEVAMQNFRENKESLDDRRKIIENECFGKSISIREGLNINDFTPQLWNLVSSDSGYIAGFENKCIVVGYNTPIKNHYGFYYRCLAIYEYVNGRFLLRKQSLNAIEDFSDIDSDLLFDTYNEINFSVSIANGDVIVNYSYMRGEASYTFTNKEGSWLLKKYEAGHRTCCEAEHYSYDYESKLYNFSVFSTSEDDSKDTSITVIQERPIMYMDSLNIRAFDYGETGLIAK